MVTNLSSPGLKAKGSETIKCLSTQGNCKLAGAVGADKGSRRPIETASTKTIDRNQILFIHFAAPASPPEVICFSLAHVSSQWIHLHDTLSGCMLQSVWFHIQCLKPLKFMPRAHDIWFLNSESSDCPQFFEGKSLHLIKNGLSDLNENFINISILHFISSIWHRPCSLGLNHSDWQFHFLTNNSSESE
jgi:hypothetical protein